MDNKIKEICLGISQRYEVHFLEIGTDQDHIHFLIQSTPTITVTKLVTIIKSITAKKIFEWKPEVKKSLWGSSLWSSGYYASTVGKHGSEDAVGRYVRSQGVEKEYKKLHSEQLRMF